METLIESRWRNGEVPITNGFTFPDGCIRPVQPVEIYRREPLTLPIEPELPPPPEGTVFWTGVSPFASIYIPGLGVHGVAGECGQGADGYVALYRNCPEHRKLAWIAFFDFSNPFVSLAYEEGHVIACNSHGQRWHLPVSAEASILVA